MMDVDVGGGQREQFRLQHAGEYDRRITEERDHPFEHREPLVPAPLAACAEAIGNDADAAPGHPRRVIGAVEPRMKAIDRAALANIECLACRGASGGVNEQHAAKPIGRGKRLRRGAADVAGADDRDCVRARG